MKTLTPFIVAAALVAAPAFAQTPIFVNSSQAFSPLSGPGVTDITSQFGASADDVGISLTIPFSFPYFGTGYTSVVVNSNGVFQLGSTTCKGSFVCSGGGGFPSTTTPNGLLAPWWDDMKFTTATTAKTWSSSSQFTVEILNLSSYSAGYVISFQLTFNASGIVTYAYGPISGTISSSTGSASVGYENTSGNKGFATLANAGSTACTPFDQSGCCSNPSNGSGCTSADWVANSLTTILPLSNSAELSTSKVAFSNVSVDAGVVTLGYSGVIDNLGLQASGAFNYRVFLGRAATPDLDTDGGYVADGRTLADGGQASMQLDQGGPLNLSAWDAGVSSVTVTGTGTTPVALSTGEFFVMLQADSDNTVTEATKGNNLAASALSFVQGTDLQAQSISGPAASQAGSSDSVVLGFINRGTVGAQGLVWRVYYSTDTTLDASDMLVGSGTRDVGPGETVNDVVQVTVPAAAPQGDVYYILQLNPAKAVIEARYDNDVVASSAKVTIRRSDLQADSARLVDPVTGAVTTQARFGEAARVTASVSNQGAVVSAPVKVAVVLSTDATLSLLSDTIVLEQDFPALSPAGSAALTLDVALPTVDVHNHALATGNYYLFFVVDSMSTLYESNEGNNSLTIGPVRITAPGPDLTVSTVQAPAAAGVGDTIPVFRTLRNVGNLDAPAVHYRYYASANTIITTDDVPLDLLVNGTATSQGSVTLAKGDAQSATDLVRLPISLVAGPWYVGCLIDPDATVSEIDETNNGLASSVVQISGSSLKISTTQLPDAIVGRPYLYRLAASGEQGTSTWAIDAAELPAGLTLSATDGLLSGTPTGPAGVTAMTVTLTNSGRTATARLALRELAPSPVVDITTTALPSVVNNTGITYQAVLGAAGGQSPYSWRVVSGTLPNGLSLSTAGVLSGSPKSGVAEGVSPVTFAVHDAVGSAAQATFNLRVVAAGSILFRTLTLPDGISGNQYLTDIAVENADGSALAKPLSWSVEGALPDGLSLQPESEIVSIGGTPSTAGRFAFTIVVVDARGRSAAADFSLTIAAPRYKLVVTDWPTVLRPGDSANLVFSVAPANPVHYALESGHLPPGLSLSADGVISGTVAADDTGLGTWNFVVGASDGVGSGLGPYALRVEKVAAKTGCSAGGLGLSPFALLALLGLWLRKSRAVVRALPAFAAVALLLPQAAQAQYQVEGPTAATWSPIVGGTALSFGLFTDSVSVPLPFPFTYYGQSVSSVTYSRYGYLALSGSTGDDSYNDPIPSSASSTYGVNTSIAPWWDGFDTTDSRTGSKWQVQGSAPNRVAVFEWTAAYSSSASAVSFQVQLFETTGRIRFAYGPNPATAPSMSASVGLQRVPGDGLSAIPCAASGNCPASSWPANSVMDFYTPPDLVIASLTADQTGYAGVAFHTTAQVKNVGGRAVTGVVVRAYLSTDAVFDSGDVTIGETTLATLPADGSLVAANITGTLPANVAQGRAFVFAMVDPDSAILEADDTNNLLGPITTTIGAQRPDLAIAGFTGPATATPGAMVSLTRSFTNTGNAAAGAFAYSYFLSDNPSVSISDRALSPVGQVTSLAVHAVDTTTESVALPTDLVAGNYWLGVCVNYDASTGTAFALDEISFVNDCSSSPTPVVISAGQLAVTTTTLPGATQYAPWGLRLSASGGNGQYAWALDTGSSLPAGLTLTAQGDLRGIPTAASTTTFTVKVTSGSSTVSQSLSLAVAAAGLPLVMGDQSLPSAEFGRSYSASLVAVGGKAPYAWSLGAGAALPVGLALAPDGTVEGRANEVGDFQVAVVVTDAAQASVSKEIAVHVVNPVSLAIATRALPGAMLSEGYRASLVAVGGRAPYAWSVVRFQQLAENETEEPQGALTALPDALGLALSDTATEHLLAGVPKQAGLYLVALRVTDAAGAQQTATLQLSVTYRDGLAITTTQLPDAFLNRNYVVKLSTDAEPGVAVHFSLPCVKQELEVGKYSCAVLDANQALPAGLTLGADGSIIGAPTSEGTFSFLVKVTDDANRQDVRSLSIHVQPNYADQTSGCSGTGLSPSLLALLSLGLWLARRRSNNLPLP